MVLNPTFNYNTIYTSEIYDTVLRVWDMVFDASFNNMSVISLQSVLLVEEALDENHRPVASHWQTFSHKVVSSTQTDWMGSCKSNHVTIKTTTAPRYIRYSTYTTCTVASHTMYILAHRKWRMSGFFFANMDGFPYDILPIVHCDCCHFVRQVERIEVIKYL